MTDSLKVLFQSDLYPIKIHAGRDIGAGHLRGWGLEFGALYDRIAQDPIFIAAFQAAVDRKSLLSLHKLANLYLTIRYAMAEDSGDIYEFGSYRGGSAVFMGTVLKLLGRNAKVYAYDTFEGMPATDPVRDLHSQGDFADAGYQELLDYIQNSGLGPYVETVRGEFQNTLPERLARGGKVGFLHVDCDIYDAVKYVIRTCAPRLSDGSHIALDDPLHGSCIGAFDAVQELLIRELNLTAEQVYPHLVFRYPPI